MKYFFLSSLLVLFIFAGVSVRFEPSDTHTGYNQLIEYIPDEQGFNQSPGNGFSSEDKYQNVEEQQYPGKDNFYIGSLT